jgi:hypothetical protein
MSEKSCCKTNNKDAAKKGLLYGLLAHLPCIGLIIIMVLGLSVGGTFIATLMSSYMFYGLIALSIILVTITAIIYLKRNDGLSFKGIKENWKYLSILYGIAIIINILFLTVIFPYSLSLVNAEPNDVVLSNTITNNNLSQFAINVNIPCSGHAFLIKTELFKNQGVTDVDYSFPSKFKITYDSSKTSQDEILNRDIFKQYPAKVI